MPAAARPDPKALLAWYDRHRRDLPWRARPAEEILAEAHVRHYEAEAGKLFAVIKNLAIAARVVLEPALVESDDIHKQIIAVAKKKKCDLICMASHGRRGLAGLVLGSETHKVLTHSKIPVLVMR